MDKLESIFRTEAEELLADLERALLDFENDLSNSDAIRKIFRVMHTLKGSASMFGFESLSAFTHDLETIYDAIREGKMKTSPLILEVTLESLDHIKNLINDPQLTDSANARLHAELIAKVRALLYTGNEVKIEQALQTTVEKEHTYYIYCKPAGSIFSNGTNPLFLVDDLTQLGVAKVFPCLSEVPELHSLNSSVCYTTFEIILATAQSVEAIREVFLFVEDSCEVSIRHLGDGNLFTNQAFAESVAQFAASLNEKGTRGFDAYAMFAKASLSGAERSKEGLAVKDKKENSTIRVSSDKLDELMNLVSELVTSQARLSLLTAQHGLADLTVVSETMEKLTRRLRDNAFNICLVPIESLVVRFQRLVRDLSKELNKEIEFVAEGTETELDRSIIEKVTDPILHILRNSIDHGIETTDVRTSNGKNRKGTIKFKAFHSGTNVFIQISDDGKGIDAEKIRAKAIDKGLISAEANLTNAEALNFIFAAGFSTAERVTDVSGRGVGMDIVKRNIESIHGEVSVESTLGSGTVITIKLPLTLSILDGMLVEVGTSKYLLPLSAIQTCYEIESAKLSQDIAQKHAFNGELLPVLNLHAAFKCAEKRNRITQVIKIGYDQFPIGISVDAIIGEYQAVMKPLGDLYKKHDEFSGATILGDGSVALVLDTSTLIRQLIKDENVRKN